MSDKGLSQSGSRLRNDRVTCPTVPKGAFDLFLEILGQRDLHDHVLTQSGLVEHSHPCFLVVLNVRVVEAEFRLRAQPPVSVWSFK